MIKPDIVVGLLRSLREHVGYLRKLQNLTLKELIDDFVKWNATLHLLQVSIEHVTDISAHMLAGAGAVVPDNYRLILRKMGETALLPYDFAERIAPMAGFRNIVVHHYLTVDPVIVDDLLHNRLGDFDEFALHIYDYLRREGHLPSEEKVE